MRCLRSLWFCLAFFAIHVANAEAGLVFNLIDGTDLISLQNTDPMLYNNVRNGFTSAGALWSSRLSDNVTININIDYTSLGAGLLGSTSSTTGTLSYNNFRTALTNDITSASDSQAVANLPGGNAFTMRTNDRAGAVITDNDASAELILLMRLPVPDRML